MGHPDRLRIIETLSQHPAYVGELAERLGLEPASVSRHLRVMQAAGVLDCAKRGNRMLYVLADAEVSRLVAAAYRGGALQAQRVIGAAARLPAASGHSDDEATSGGA